MAWGYDGNDRLDRVLLYRLDTDQWRAAASFNGKRYNGELVVINGRILYIGGKQAMCRTQVKLGEFLT